MPRAAVAAEAPSSWPTIADEMLNEYEKARKPHIPPPGAGEAVVELPFNEMLPEMKCPICLSIVTEASAIQECLHRFCTECIIKSLASRKECPTCRVKVATRRALRKDPTFDSLVNVIYPDKDAFERRQTELLRKVRENSNQNAMIESFDQGIKLQEHARKERQLAVPRASGWGAARNLERVRANQLLSGGSPPTPEVPEKRSHHKDHGTASASKRPRTDSASSSPIRLDHLELLMEPHPLDGDFRVALSNKYIEVPVDCTFGHLKDFLEKQLPKEHQGPPKSEVARYNLSLNVSGHGYIVQRDYTTPVAVVFDRLPPQDKLRRLVVYYSSPGVSGVMV